MNENEARQFLSGGENQVAADALGGLAGRTRARTLEPYQKREMAFGLAMQLLQSRLVSADPIHLAREIEVYLFGAPVTD